MSTAILLISCPDSRGITAGVTQFIAKHNGNIHHSDQHIDEQTNTFFMRVEWSLEDFELSRDDITNAFDPIAKKYQMTWDLSFRDVPMRVAVFVSKHLHCLADLLYRYQNHQLNCEIPVVISNHPDAQKMVSQAGIDFQEYPITPENKVDQEEKELALLKAQNIDLVILARYHQILTGNFVSTYQNRIINIHHSFLPAFAGKDPYAQAYQKGVKIIGATAHYVTPELDQGPIIEQDIVRVSHRDSLQNLKWKGEDLEKVVLNRAFKLHLERKILNYNNKTVVFD